MTVDIAMLSEMLPCPFCGDVEELDVREREGGWLAICGACAGHMYADSRAGAIAGWNTRFEASLPPSAPVDAGGGNKGLREALQGLLTLVDGCLTAEMIAEGMHAGLRKGSDAPDAAALWRAIADSKTSAWSDAARFAVDPFFTMWGKKALADARALLATPSVLAESTSNDCLLVAEGWQDIASAPKDGTPFLVFTAGEYDIARWHRDHACGVDCGAAIFTHWRPLPAPPAVTDLSGVGVG